MTAEMIERVAKAIEGAELGYQIRLVSLIDGVSTYTINYSDGVGPLGFGSHGEALDHYRARDGSKPARATQSD